MEEESFNDVMGHAPVYSSGLPGVSVTNPAEFKEWHGRVRRAHEREVREHTLEYDIDGLSDRELAEHGLVRMPVDADGVRWTGDETEHYAPNGDSIPALGLLYHHGEWFVTDRDGAYLAKECHHTKPADTPASMADVLDAWAESKRQPGYNFVRIPMQEFRNFADRLRKMGGAE